MGDRFRGKPRFDCASPRLARPFRQSVRDAIAFAKVPRRPFAVADIVVRFAERKVQFRTRLVGKPLAMQAIPEQCEIGMFCVPVALRRRQADRYMPFPCPLVVLERKQIMPPRQLEIAQLDLQHPGIGMQTWIIWIGFDRYCSDRSGISLAVTIVKQLDCADGEIGIAAIRCARETGAKG
ncbi:MAG TPA: hypothetical protein VIM92_11170 [Rhodanobacteraceae bacterium]